MRISKLDHLVLVTSDLSRCVSFYRDLLHMEAVSYTHLTLPTIA